MDLKCDFNSPCSKGGVCDVPRNKCVPSSEIDEETYQLDGNLFIATRRELMEKVQKVLEDTYDLKCTTGFNAISMVMYDNELIRHLQEDTKMTSFVDLSDKRPQILCDDYMNVKQYWQKKHAEKIDDHGRKIPTFLGYAIRRKPLDKMMEELTAIKKTDREREEFMNLSLWPGKFFYYNDLKKVLNNDTNVFAIVKTNMVYMDANSTGVSVYHNNHRGGDPIYEIFPIRLKDEPVQEQGYFEENFGDSLENLEILELSGLKLSEKSLRYIFNRAKNLVSLNIARCHIISIPDDIKNLNKLKYLDISGNFISDILPVTTLENLLSLKGDNNLLETIPYNISKLTKLRVMSLTNNWISKYSGFSKLKRLKYFDLSHNYIYSLNPLLATTGLIELNVSFNSLEDIPMNINKLKNLEILKLQNNRIVNISKNLGQLKKLRYLDLSNNKIMIIPEEVFEDSNLDYVRLDNNKLVTLPRNIPRTIRILSIAKNRRIPEHRKPPPAIIRTMTHRIRQEDMKDIEDTEEEIRQKEERDKKRQQLESIGQKMKQGKRRRQENITEERMVKKYAPIEEEIIENMDTD